MEENKEPKPKINGYPDFLKEFENNENNHEPNNKDKNGNLPHNEEQKDVKSLGTNTKNELTVILEENDYKSKTLSENAHTIIEYGNKNLNDQRRKRKEICFIGNKRSSADDIALKNEDISQLSDEINMAKDFNDIIVQILKNPIEFFNIKSESFDYLLNFTTEKNIISNYMNNKDILEKNLKEIILLSQENDIKKENILNKIETILLKEKDSNNLEFFNMFNMKLKELLLIYINDRDIKFNNFKLKTLKDNINYSGKEKEQIKKILLDYINSPKESASNNSFNKLAIFQTSSNLISLSNNEVIENDEIKNVISIKKNKRQNITKKEMNQEKEEEQKFSNTKTKDKTDENRGCRLENLVRMTVKQIYLFVFKTIEKILAKNNKKIQKVLIYSYITGNSAILYKNFFKKKIIDILTPVHKEKKINGKLKEDILEDNNNLDELELVKELLNMTFLDIINIFLKDETLNFKNGTSIKINIFEYTELDDEIKTKKYKKMKKEEILMKREKIKNQNDKIKKNIEEIKKKLKEIAESKDRLRKKKKSIAKSH